MGLFDKIKEPVFLKESSSAEAQLAALKIVKSELLKQPTTGKLLPQIEQEIKIVEAGIAGEKQIMYELRNSHMPMVVLHDLYFEKDGYTAQIDYLIITRSRNFVLECKNLIGNIDIDSAGNFTRTLSNGKSFHKEGIYSPVTQNQRHMELIKKIRRDAKNNFITKTVFEKNFLTNYRSVVVLANPKSVLNAKYATKEIKNQVIRADQLIAYIKKVNEEKDAVLLSEKEMLNLAQFFMAQQKENPKDYLAKYKEKLGKAEPEPIITEAGENDTINEKEPLAESHLLDENHVNEKQSGEENCINETKSMKENNISEKRPLDENHTKEKVPAEEKDKQAQILCLKCGAAMIKRTATKGGNAGKEFYGCSRFPQCRSIVNISP